MPEERLPPPKRDWGTAFQSLEKFPHLFSGRKGWFTDPGLSPPCQTLSQESHHEVDSGIDHAELHQIGVEIEIQVPH